MYAATGAPILARHRWPGGDPAASATATATDRRTGVVLATDVAAEATTPGELFTVTLDPVDDPTVVDVEWTITDAGDTTTVTGRPVEVVTGRLVDPSRLVAAGTLDVFDLECIAAAVTDRVVHYAAPWPARWTTGRAVVQDRRGLVRLEVALKPAVPVRSLAVTLDGDPVTVDRLEPDVGLAWLAGGIAPGTTVDVELEYGYGAAPFDVADAALEAARQVVSDRVNLHRPARAEYADGTTWLVTTASPRHGRLFGIPDVDAVLVEHRTDALVA